MKKFGHERAIAVKYEDLLVNPENEVKRICKILGITYSEDILKYYESEESLIIATLGELWRNLTRPIIHNNFIKYKKGMNISEIELYKLIAGWVLTDFGDHPGKEGDHPAGYNEAFMDLAFNCKIKVNINGIQLQLGYHRYLGPRYSLTYISIPSSREVKGCRYPIDRNLFISACVKY